jgi:outer membrane protein assembly factor BamB
MRKIAITLPAILLLCCFGVWEGQGRASPWPRFRGPNGAGIAADQNIPVEWTNENGVLWKTALPGVGNSSPIVWGDRLFLQAASKDGKERSLLCVGVRDGKILWSRSVPGSVARTHAKNSLASSTPATDGERVYAVFWDGQEVFLQAYDFTGKPLWKQGLGGFNSQHGAGTSPIVYRDKVFVTHDQDGAAELMVFEAQSGKPVWNVPRRAFRACYSTPMILEHPESAPELIVVSTGGITSYHPDTGTENWNYSWTSTRPFRTVASPVYSQGLIFANSGDGDGSRHTIAVKAAGTGDISKTNLVWEEKRTFPYVPTMLAFGKHLYYVNDHGLAGCNVAATGESVWSKRLTGSVYASPVLINGKIYVIGENGAVFVIEAAPTFKLLAKNSVGEPVLATPAVADNRLYIRGTDHLYCISKPVEKHAKAN